MLKIGLGVRRHGFRSPMRRHEAGCVCVQATEVRFKHKCVALRHEQGRAIGAREHAVDKNVKITLQCSPITQGKRHLNVSRNKVFF